MASLPGFPSLDPSLDDDDPWRARSRLVALRDVPSSSADPAGLDAGEAVAGPPPQAGPAADRAVRATSRAARLVQRWVPAPLRDARWEPGRPGALMLSLVAALAAVVAAIGVWWERPVPEPAPVLPLVTAAAKAPPAPPQGPVREVVISVVGRVARPGLIHLPEGARVADALAAAGGALPGTDLMGLNIARRLSDGEQVPVGIAPPPGQLNSAPAPETTGVPPVVDLNSATLEQLDALPGVGMAMAQRVLDWRQAHGRFTSVDQLRQVSGFGQARLAKLKHRVRV